MTKAKITVSKPLPTVKVRIEGVGDYHWSEEAAQAIYMALGRWYRGEELDD